MNRTHYIAGMLAMVLALILPSPAQGESQDLELPAVQRQDDEWSCGVNAITRILKGYGVQVTYADMKTRIGYMDLLGYRIGKSPHQIVERITALKSSARYEINVTTNPPLDRIKALIQERKPVMALIRVGTLSLPIPIPRLHWIVITGLNDLNGTISYYDSTDNQRHSMTRERFEQQWDWKVEPGIVQDTLASNKVTPRTIIWIDEPLP